MILQTAPDVPEGDPASPPIVADNVSDLDTEILSFKDKLEAQIYGVMPREFKTKEVSRKLINDNAFGGTTIVEEVRLQALQPVDGGDPRPVVFNMVLAIPKTATEPAPIIMMQNFCPNHSVIPVDGISKPDGTYFDCSGDGVMGKIFTFFFGRYITTPPIEQIMTRGYAIAAVYPHETYPDSASAVAFYNGSAPDVKHPWGAIAAWAYQFSLMADHLGEDERFRQEIAYGHSRFGKSALISAAFDRNIDGVIAHQSGTGGASLSKNKKGETVADITESYPHWFTPGYAESKLSIDQHHLLAAVSPTPILLGNAKRDVWSDPEGAFRAAQGAKPVYELFKLNGLEQNKLTDFNPKARIAFWMRPGTHGVVQEDWPAFLEFLDANFK